MLYLLNILRLLRLSKNCNLLISIHRMTTEILQRDAKDRLKEKSFLDADEREFMLAWNKYLHTHPLHGDREIPAVCTAFAECHKESLSENAAFRRCFVMHLTNLWRFALIDPQQIQVSLKAGTLN